MTNHALLAIDTLGEGGILPEHRVVIVDEAHELVDRVTSVASGELSAHGDRVRGAPDRQAGRRGGGRPAVRGGQRARPAARHHAGRPDGPPRPRPRRHADRAAGRRRRRARCRCARSRWPKDDDADPAEVTAAQTALVSLEEIGDRADRMVTSFDQPIAEREEVVWLERPEDWADGAARPAVPARRAA